MNKSEQQAQQSCKYCNSFNKQQKIILKRLKKIKFLANLSKKPQSDKQFERLILIMNSKFSPILFQNCRHKNLIKNFTSTLKCSQMELFSLSQALADRLARKNYELEILTNQIKNTENSISNKIEKGFDFPKDHSQKNMQFNEKIQNNMKSQQCEQLREKQILSNKTLYNQNGKYQQNQINSINSLVQWPLNYQNILFSFFPYFSFQN